ncbi:alpha-1,3-arabinosyltransferase XAT3-like [Carex rostrata]
MQESRPTITEVIVNKSKLIYNSANPRYNICSIEGDIRIIPDASTIFVVSPTPLDPNTTTWKIKPYPRKWEPGTMEGVTEMTIQQLTDANQARSCDVNHDLPAVVFSTFWFTGNLFHDHTDLIYPLFLAAHRYNGEVKLVVEDYVSKSIEKYRPYLTRLSHYPIINLDNETRVHCFSSAQVGIENLGPLGYKFQNPENDQAMQKFTGFIRESLSLERSEVEKGKKPRLLVLLRKNTRSIINEDDVINLAKDVGFEVVTADEETTKDFPRIAHIVNSCDVLMGIHGAGLANMLYLPTNGTVLQIIPFGNLKWVGRFDYGDPPSGFGLKYVEYEITVDESTLTEQYPRDHPVLTDPQSIHKKGFHEVYVAYLWKQSVKLNVDRFRGTLEETFQFYQYK